MIFERLIVIIITIALILSVLSVIFTVSSINKMKLVQPEIRQNKVIIPVHETGNAKVGLVILNNNKENNGK